MIPPKKASLSKAKRKASARQTPVQVIRKPGSIQIKYSDPRHVLPHLMGLIPEFTEEHLAALDTNDDVLGTDAAKEIVSGCANSTCWTCTLGDLKLDSALFQTCVFGGVKAKGYIIDKDDIPASQDTQLYTVVIAIQGAKKG